MARFALILTLLLAASAAPARADDADLWATVNVCDTAAHPDEVGIRASMPGGKRGTRLQMRFRVAVPRPLDRPLARGPRRRLGLAQGREGAGRRARRAGASRSPARGRGSSAAS